MSDVLVAVKVEERVAVITLNRPDALNALNTALRSQLVSALQALDADPDVRVIVLTGSGRAFCAGLDFAELQAAGDDVAENGIVGRELLAALDAVKSPVIAAVNGFAITGGLELVLRCDVIVASSAAVFADTHAKVGIVPAWGASQILPRLIGPYRAKEMSLSGRKVDAQQAYEWGLVNRVVEPNDLLEAACALGREMAGCDRDAQLTIKGLIEAGWWEPMADAFELEQEVSMAAFTKFAGK
mgnify:CR=1 FL=1